MRRILLAISTILLLSVPAIAATTGAPPASQLGVYTTDNVPQLNFGYVDQYGGIYTNQVNELIVTGAATTVAPSITAGGSNADTNVSIAITPKGSGTVSITNLATSGNNVTQGTQFSTAQAANPLLLQTVQTITVASINAGYVFLASTAGRTIYPSNLTVTPIGGNASGATSVTIQCVSGNVLGTFPIANLISAKAVTYSSTSVVTGMGFTGCASGDGLSIFKTGGSLATSTALIVNIPYTVQ